MLLGGIFMKTSVSKVTEMSYARASVSNNCEILPGDAGGGSASTDSSTQAAQKNWYLCYFIHHLLNFRISDVESVVEMLGCPLEDIAWRRPHGDAEVSPFWYLRLPSEDLARRVADRTMLTRVRTLG